MLNTEMLMPLDLYDKSRSKIDKNALYYRRLRPLWPLSSYQEPIKFGEGGKMSILRNPYEITIWEDIWDPTNSKFVEVKICTIGSDKMESQSRALEPILTRNVNGTKKLTFKMYKQYVDNITGEKVTNPFTKYLVSERKVKLNYRNKWYDFIIKHVDENSSTHLCTYQLDDAIVQELSKNGYGVTLDEQLNNNIGTAKELATRVLEDTNWTVDSEIFVQKVEETLVYLTNSTAISVQKITDQADGYATGVTNSDATLPAGSTILAFYSSCTNKPHRFQFIYTGEDAITTNENRVIDNENCQYYIDYSNPENKYKEDQVRGFYLPEEFSVKATNE
jgi:hypothetical protein